MGSVNHTDLKHTFSTPFDVDTRGPSVADRALEKIMSEATFLRNMCNGQSRNIGIMQKEQNELLQRCEALTKQAGLLTRMNDRQSDTIVELQKKLQDVKAFYNVSISDFARICREAEFGRKMAASAGVNIP